MSVYTPLVDAFRNRDPRSQLMLEEIGRRIHETNPDSCASVVDGVEAARRAFAYYCDCFLTIELSARVHAHYGLPGSAPHPTRLPDPPFSEMPMATIHTIGK